MLGAGLVGRDEGQIDFRLHRGREFDLRLLGPFLEPLQRHLVFRKIDSLILLEFFDDPFDETFIDVITTQVSVAVR